MSSYGGIRQILEFAPGMALLAGYAAHKVYKSLKNKLFSQLFIAIIIISFIPLVLSLYRIHPNENVYFNALIGGSKGAKTTNFPGWGDTFGNNYYQAIAWVNTHTPLHSRVSYSVQGMHNYVPFSKVRPDILIGEKNWSDTEKRGEYIIEPNVNDGLVNIYTRQYELKTLIPLYTITVDTVPIAYVYKNDSAHTKIQYRKSEIPLLFQIAIIDNQYYIDVINKTTLTKLYFSYNKACKTKPNGFVYYQDAKGNWIQLRDTLGEQYYTLPYFDMGGVANTTIYYFPYIKTGKIKLSLFKNSAVCTSTLSDISLKGISE